MAAGGQESLLIGLLDGELWWGGAVADGELMPFGDRFHDRDLSESAGISGAVGFGSSNQSAPVLLSNRGRFVWSEQPFAFAFSGGVLRLRGEGLVHAHPGQTLRGAFTAAARYFPPSGAIPPEQMFSAPQYNTWIEMPYEPTQPAVLEYVEALLDTGFPPGVVMIDDRWSTDYGTWRFDRTRFPDPGAMVDRLHDLGYAVMLWLVPFISPDSDVFRVLSARRLLVRTAHGEPAIRQWWNGYSAILDATNPDAVAWLHTELGALQTDFGIDGFKFDGGDLWSYQPDDVVVGSSAPTAQSQAWGEIGLRYPFNEYRACWKLGGQPLAQRLCDKPPVWGPGGLASLIPQAIAQGLIGHAFVCPDMIGGGELEVFRSASYSFDQELFVRYAQCAALCPMMQFSISPARVLDLRHLRACLAAVKLHHQLLPDIIRLARDAASSGEPIVRPLAYEFDDYEHVHDQFLLGEQTLAAPVLQAGASFRDVVLPPGRWQDQAGKITAADTLSASPSNSRQYPSTGTPAKADLAPSTHAPPQAKACDPVVDGSTIRAGSHDPSCQRARLISGVDRCPGRRYRHVRRPLFELRR